MKKILLIALSIMLLLGAVSPMVSAKAKEEKYKIERIGEATEADKAFSKQIMKEIEKGKTPDEVFEELGFVSSDETTYMFEVEQETNGKWKKTGKVIKIKDGKFTTTKNGVIVDSGDVSALDKTSTQDYVTLTLQNSRGTDPESGEKYVYLKYLYSYKSGSNFYKDAFGVAWDTQEVYGYDVIYTSNLTTVQLGTGWQGFEVDSGSKSGSVWALTHPREDEPIEDVHGEYTVEYAHAYGAPAGWTFTGTLWGVVSIGYTTQGSVDKDTLRDAF